MVTAKIISHVCYRNLPDASAVGYYATSYHFPLKMRIYLSAVFLLPPSGQINNGWGKRAPLTINLPSGVSERPGSPQRRFSVLVKVESKSRMSRVCEFFRGTPDIRKFEEEDKAFDNLNRLLKLYESLRLNCYIYSNFLHLVNFFLKKNKSFITEITTTI